jgi:polyhydroxybutyrate depolymerase
MKPWLQWLIRIPLILLALVIALLLVAWVAYRLSDRTNGSLVSSAGEKRSYLLYVPETYDPSTPTPLVITIHGFVQWPANQMHVSRWNELADEYGFLVVYPSGTGFPKRWRASGGPAQVEPDVVFLSDLIDRLESEYNLDPARIYVNGLSNGGGMSFVLACELSDRVAAFGSVAGAYMYPFEACQPSRPVPAIIFHGTADPIVPYWGGPSRDFNLPFPAIPDWVATLARRDGCPGPVLDLPTNGNVSGVEYTGCAADVVFYTIAGGGHSWPGGNPLPKWLVGITTQDIEATRTMWAFFQQHPLSEK